MLALASMMFWKAIIVSAWGGIVGAWASFRKERTQRGIPMRQDKRGVYTPDDWAAKTERAVRFAGRAFLIFVYIDWALLVCAYVYLRWF